MHVFISVHVHVIIIMQESTVYSVMSVYHNKKRQMGQSFYYIHFPISTHSYIHV